MGGAGHRLAFNLASDCTSLHALTNFDKHLVGGFQA